MHETWTLTKRELHAYFASPAAYVVLSAFLLFTGWFFGNALFLENVASLRSVFNIAPVIFLVFIPAITMSTFAEERRAGTLELLLTLPIRDWQIIAGKLAAVVLFLAVAIGLTFFYAITMSMLGDLDFGATVGGYLGLLLLGTACAAIGIFASSLTRNQIVAFILAVVACFLMLIIGEPIFTIALPTWLVGPIQYFGLTYHFSSIGRGVIDSSDIIYYISVIGFFLWVNYRVIQKRR